MLPQHKKEFLEAVGYKPEEIAAVEETMRALAQKAQAQGIRSKEAPQPPAQLPAVQQPETEEEKKPDAEQESKTVDVDAQLKQAEQFIVKALEPILQPLNAEIVALKAEILALKQQGSNLTPAASVLAAKSITQQEGEHVLKAGERLGGPKENNSDKERNPEMSATGIPFLDNIMALNQQRQAK